MIGVGTWSCSDRERELVNEVLDSGRLSYGPKCREFEEKFSAIHGSKFGVLSNSGTSSLQVALQALKEEHGWTEEHEVIVPAVTFVATYNIVLHNGLKPVLVDVDPTTYNMDTEWFEEAVTPNTRCVIPVYLFGQMADMSSIVKYVWEENASRENDDDKIKILADSCECMFATHYDKPIGEWADITCFSMYVAHLLTTGVGGIGITDNPVYAKRMRSLVNHGRDGVYISIDDGAKREVMDRRFKFVSIGHSFRITELEAALGLAQLETWEEMIAKRQANARFLSMYRELLGDWVILPEVAPHNTHSFMMYPIVVLGNDKWELCKHLEENGIETREMLPLTNQPVYGIDESEFPIAQNINDCGFYVGCHQDLDEKDMKKIYETIRGFYVQ